MLHNLRDGRTVLDPNVIYAVSLWKRFSDIEHTRDVETIFHAVGIYKLPVPEFKGNEHPEIEITQEGSENAVAYLMKAPFTIRWFISRLIEVRATMKNVSKYEVNLTKEELCRIVGDIDILESRIQENLPIFPPQLDIELLLGQLPVLALTFDIEFERNDEFAKVLRFLNKCRNNQTLPPVK